MALLGCSSGAIALSASTTKHMWLLSSPATTGKIIKPTKIHLGFDGSSALPSIRWQLYRVTTLGSPAGTTGTIVKYGEAATSANTPVTTALVNLTTGPTAFEILEENYLTPFGGTLIMDFPDGKEPWGPASGNRLGFCVIVPSGVAVNGLSSVVFNEV